MKNESVQTIAKSYAELMSLMNQGIMAIKDSNINARYKSVEKSLAILEALFHNLDFEKGGEIAENLGFIYCYLIYNLGRVNMENDPKPLHDGVRLLAPLYNSWKELAEKMDDASPVDMAAMKDGMSTLRKSAMQ